MPTVSNDNVWISNIANISGGTSNSLSIGEVAVERIGNDHWTIKTGCEKRIVHDYHEAQELVVELFDRYFGPLFKTPDRKTSI